MPKIAAKAKAAAAKALKSKTGKETAASLEAAAAKSFAAIPKTKPCLEICHLKHNSISL